MEKINFSPVKGDFKNEKEKCICVPIFNGDFNIDDVHDIGDRIEEKYPNLFFTKRWSTYEHNNQKGYMFFYE